MYYTIILAHNVLWYLKKNMNASKPSLFDDTYYHIPGSIITMAVAGRPGSSEVPRNPLTRWDVSSTPANGIFLTKKLKN